MAAKININITMISDVICPWCWVAKRKLETAITNAGDKYNFKIHLEPFKLKPLVGPEGEQKPELQPGKPRVSEKLYTAGEAVGIIFSGKGDKYPDVTPSHALLAWAETSGKHLDLEEAIYKAYFTDGVFLGEENLVELAASVGLDKEQARAAMRDTDALEDASTKANYWRGKLKGTWSHLNHGVAFCGRIGVLIGVPAFYMNGVEAFQGGREADEFLRMFDVIAENYPQ